MKIARDSYLGQIKKFMHNARFVHRHGGVTVAIEEGNSDSSEAPLTLRQRKDVTRNVSEASDKSEFDETTFLQNRHLMPDL